MKVLLFITGHIQLEAYNLFHRFLKQLRLNSICDIFIHCNNPNIENTIVNYYQNFTQKNKKLFITSINGGYSVGAVEAVSEGIEMGIFKDYDYVIRTNPDVFITNDEYLLDILVNNLKNDIVFFITKSIPDPTFFSFDFFIFKPKLLTTNIFIEELYTFKEPVVEHYFHRMIMKHNIKYTYIKRFDNDNWYPRRIDDNLRLWHEHDLDLVKRVLEHHNM